MTANRPIEAVKKFVRDLQLEHYDLLHKHGYADYRLDEEPVEGYTEDALHLTELYERDLTLLLRQETDKAQLDLIDKIIDDNSSSIWSNLLKYRSELTNTQEGKDNEPA